MQAKNLVHKYFHLRHSLLDCLKCLPVWRSECLFVDYIYWEAGNTPMCFTPVEWKGKKLSSMSSFADCITLSLLRFLLQLTNLINTLSPLDLLRRLLRFNEFKVWKCQWTNMDMGIFKSSAKQNITGSILFGRKWTQVYLRIWCSLARK